MKDQAGRIPPPKNRPGVILILAAAILWGTTGTAQAFAPPGALPYGIGALRLLIGGIFLLLFAATRRSLSSLRTIPRRPVLLAAVFVALYQLYFFSGLAKTGVAVGTIIAIGSSPIFGGLLGRVFRKERLSTAWFAATLLAIAGCTLIAAQSGPLAFDLSGVFLALGAGFAYAAFTLVSKGLLVHYPPEAITGVVFCLGAGLLFPILFTNNLAWLLVFPGIPVILHLGLVATALAYLLFTRGLKHTDVSTATTLTLAEPLTASALGILLLGEKLSLPIFAGIALVFGGLAIVAVYQMKSKNDAWEG